MRTIIQSVIADLEREATIPAGGITVTKAHSDRRREFVEKISGKIKRYGALQALRTETEGRATDWMTNPRLPQLYTTRQVDEEAKEILTDIENTLYVALDEEGGISVLR